MPISGDLDDLRLRRPGSFDRADIVPGRDVDVAIRGSRDATAIVSHPDPFGQESGRKCR